MSSKANLSRFFFLFSLIFLLYSVLSNTVGYHDSWVLDGIEFPTILFVFSMVVLFVTGDISPKWLAIYATVYLTTLNLLPSFKYSLPYGTGDILTHLGLVREIYTSGHLPPTQIFGYSNFPLMHIFNAIASLIIGESPIKIFKFIVPMAMSISPLIIYIISTRLYIHIKLQKYAIFGTLLLFTNYNYFIAPASLATLLMFLTFTFIVHVTLTNRQYLGFSCVILLGVLGVVFMHHFTSLAFLSILVLCAGWFFATSESDSKRQNRTLLFIPIFYITVLFSWWMYNARWVFHLFSVNIKKYLLIPDEALKPLPIGATAEKVGVDVFIFNHIGAIIIAVLSATGILILCIDVLKKENKYSKGYAFFLYIFMFISANFILFIYQAVAGVPLVNVERMMIFGFLFAPTFMALSLFKFDGILNRFKLKNGFLVLVLFMLASLTLIEFFPSERLLPGNALNIANSEYMFYMAEYVKEHPFEEYFLASDEVTRRVLVGFTDHSIWSRFSIEKKDLNPYGESSSLLLQFLDIPENLKGQYGMTGRDYHTEYQNQSIMFLVHRPGAGGIFYEFYEANHPAQEKAWLIDRAIERQDVDLIYNNGEAFVLLKGK